MTQTIRELEQDIEESRARLDHTIDRLQDKLSASAIIDDVIGSTIGPIRDKQIGAGFEVALAIIRRHPVALVLVAAGVGLLVHFFGKGSRPAPFPARRDGSLEETGIPALNTGQARIYDPDTSPRHPTHDTLEGRREISAQA